jgi:hypothetical protein
MRLGASILLGVAWSTIMLSTAPVRAEECRTAANALLCVSPLAIGDAYQAVLAGDRKWLRELNCIQAQAGLKVTVVERSSRGWRVRVNVSDNRIGLPQFELTASVGRAINLGTRESIAQANTRSSRPTRAARNPVTPSDGCCAQQTTQDALTTETMFWASWLEFRATDGSYLDSEGRSLKIR